MATISLSPWQSEVWDDTHRYKVINAGRRAGKTMLVTMKMVDFASKNDEVKVWYIAPTYRQAKQIVWEMLSQYIPKQLISKRNETELIVYLKNGSKIELKGADSPDCYDDLTQVSTRGGWKYFKDLTKEDEVLTLNPETDKAEWHKPDDIIIQDYSGEMVSFKNRRIDMLVTPNHKFYVEKRTKKGWKKHGFVTADKLKNRLRIKKDTGKDGVAVDLDYMRFLGIYLADGSAYGNCGGDITKRRGNYTINIASFKEKQNKWVEKVLTNCGFYWKRCSTGYRFNKKSEWEKLIVLGNKYTKRFPSWVWDCNQESLEALFEGLVLGDGWLSKGCWSYASVSEDLADDFQTLCALIGKSSHKTIKKQKQSILKDGRVITPTRDIFIVSVHSTKSWYFDRSLSRQHYTGKIYCCSVKNHIIRVRRNGNDIWSGNSLRGVGLDLIMFDEVAFFNRWDECWKILRPTLADSGADCYFISCVVKDTLILGENGLERIGTSEDGYTDCDKPLFGLGGFHKAVNRYGSGLCPTKKIKTKFGFEIECTPNHKLWTLNGWKESGSFNVGDPLLIQYDQQVFGNNTDTSGFKYSKRKPKVDFDCTWSADFAYLMGLVLAEGSWDEHRLDITNTDKEIIDFLTNRFGFRTYDGVHHHLNSSKLCEFINWIGIPHGAKNKIIPEKILQLPKHLLKEFLSGYFDGDGFADSKRPRVGCSSSSKELIDQLQVLLLNFGVLAKKSVKITPPTKRVAVYSTGYRLTMEHYGASKFFNEIGFRLTRKQQFSFTYKNTYKTTFQRKDFGTLNAKYGYLGREKRVEIATLENILRLFPNPKYNLNYLEDKIVSIEDNTNYVYDFVIPETHSYFTNGFVSHNTPSGHNHFKELADNYVPKEDRRIFKDEDVAYFHFTTYDNPYIEIDEIELMKAEMDDDSFAQEILGEFRKMTGLIYKNFSRETHMVKIPFEKFNSNWTYTRSLDFGFAHKSALIYVAISPTGDEMYVYDGVYQDGLTETDIANICIVKDAGKVITNPVADSNQPMSIEQLSQLGVHFNPVEKGADSVKNGITKVSELLKIRADTGKPTIMFNQNLPWIADELEKYRWMERKTDGVVKEVPYKKNDDFCFTAGTPIITKRGNIPIEKVTTKDLVYTPYGWSRVISCGSTGIKPVKDYGVFTATPNHKIITNRGIVELDAISNSDTIMVCKTKQSAGTVSIIEDTPTQKTELIDFIFKGLLTRGLVAKLAFYTEKYGSQYTGKYPKAIISIIKTVTRLITTLTTLCYLLPKSIIILIRLILNGIIESTLIKLDHLLKSGIGQQRGVLYTRLLEKWLGIIENKLQRIVQSVVKSTKPLSLQEANTVIKTAKQQPSGDAEVFNLATSRGMYFANNVLVSNCDSLRYYAMSYKKPHQRQRKSRRNQLSYSTMGKNLY